MVEFRNVLIGYTVTKRMMLALPRNLLEEADRLPDEKLGRISHTQVLTTAARHRVTARDARFLALAERLGLRLITEDSKPRSGHTCAHAIVGRSSGGGLNRGKVAAKEQ